MWKSSVMVEIFLIFQANIYNWTERIHFLFDRPKSAYSADLKKMDVDYILNPKRVNITIILNLE